MGRLAYAWVRRSGAKKMQVGKLERVSMNNLNGGKVGKGEMLGAFPQNDN